YGLLDRDGRARLHHGLENSTTNSLSASWHNGDGSEEVAIRRASAFLAEQGIDRVSLLKIDTEGAEVPILRDLAEVLERTDAVQLEYHSEDDRLEIDKLLSDRFLLYAAQADHAHRGTLTYVAKEVVVARTTYAPWRIPRAT